MAVASPESVLIRIKAALAQALFAYSLNTFMYQRRK